MHVTVNELITTIYRTPSLSVVYCHFGNSRPVQVKVIGLYWISVHVYLCTPLKFNWLIGLRMWD